MFRIKNYLPLFLSSLLILGLGFFSGKIFLSEKAYPTIDVSDSIVASADIKLYTDTAVSIVIGTVEALESSDAQISVEETLKGTPSKIVSVLLPPSESEGSHFLVPQEYGLFFLCQNTAGDLVLCGDLVGKCLIDKDKEVLRFGTSNFPVAQFKSEISSVLGEKLN